MSRDTANAAPGARPGLRLFLDSARPADWETWLPRGVFHGVTTNPVLLQRADQPCTLANLEAVATRVRDLGAREIQLQTWGATPGEMFHNGSRLALMTGLGLDVAVKVPATPDGLVVARRLAEAGTRVTLTAVFQPGQVVLAAGFGAAYAAPYLGRLIDARRKGRDLVLAMDDILKYTGSATRLLVASLRSTDQVIDLAAHGLDTFTFGAPVAEQLLSDKLTEKATAQFEAAAAAMGGRT
ncbi:transaldolase [bacterium]|nr:transaldolase [bacterium]